MRRGVQFPEVEQVTHLHSHVLPEKPGQLVVVLGVRMGEEWRNRAADVAERMQAALHEVEGVAAADIHMDLTRSGFPDGRGGMGFPPGVFDRRKAIFGSGELEH